MDNFNEVIELHFKKCDQFFNKVMACQIFDQLFGFRRSDFRQTDQFPNKRNERGEMKNVKKMLILFQLKVTDACKVTFVT